MTRVLETIAEAGYALASHPIPSLIVAIVLFVIGGSLP